MAPHTRPNSPQLIVSLFEKAALPVVGSITRRRPCSFVSMTSSTCGAFWSWWLAEPDLARAWRAACSPTNRTSSMLSSAAWSAAAVGAAPAGVAEVSTGCDAPL